MATPATHAAIAKALAAELKAHPLLRGVRTWRLRDGSTGADDPPSAAQCPWVRLTPTTGVAEPHSRRAESLPLVVLVEAAVSGRDFAAADDLATKLWRAVMDRTESGTHRLRAAVRAAGASGLTFDRPARPADGGEYGEATTTARGTITVKVFIRTR